MECQCHTFCATGRLVDVQLRCLPSLQPSFAAKSSKPGPILRQSLTYQRLKYQRFSSAAAAAFALCTRVLTLRCPLRRLQHTMNRDVIASGRTASNILLTYAVFLTATGGAGYVMAPVGANAQSALVMSAFTLLCVPTHPRNSCPPLFPPRVPGGSCAAVALLCGALSRIPSKAARAVGIHVGLLLCGVVATVLAWRATLVFHNPAKQYLFKLLTAMSVGSVAFAIILLRNKPPSPPRGKQT